MKIVEYVTCQPGPRQRSDFVTDARNRKTDHCTRDSLDGSESVAADGTPWTARASPSPGEPAR
jgi:hypothetical protein